MRREAAWRMAGGLALGIVLVPLALVAMGIPVPVKSCAEICAAGGNWWLIWLLYGCQC